METIDLLEELHDKNYEKVSAIGKASKTALKVFEYLEKSPIIDSSEYFGSSKSHWNFFF